ncbi:MAG: T9SS type A sorting domain-containing protein [Bacteroidia bacterium]|nr:T9SS type A sorting domain-containing protein [Bacteroidia bacterium]
MKNVLNFSLCVFYVMLKSQTWQKSFDFNNGNTDLCFKIIESSKQHYILCGASSVPSQFSYGFDGVVLALNQNGDTIWTKKLGSMSFGAQNDFLFDVIENNNNELILTGIRKQGTQKQQLWIVKIQLNQTGTQITNITEKQIGLLNKDDGGAKIIQNPDGTYFIVGFTESMGSQQGGKDAWLLKLNSNLDTIWTKTYDFGYSDEGSYITPFQNGYLILINSITGLINFPVPYYTSFANVLYVDNNGNIIKHKIFNTDTLNSFNKAKLTSDGGAILIGSTNKKDNNYGGRDIYIVKLNSNADTVWTKIYGGYGKYDGGTDIIQHTDGTYFVSSYSQSKYTQNVDNWWLLRLKNNGDTLYTKWVVTLPDNDDPSGMIFSSDGKLVVAGWINANSNPANGWNMGNSNIHVIKMDTSFNFVLSFDRDPIPKLSNLNVNIYPNPFSEKTNIFISTPSYKNFCLKIYDVFGKELRKLDNVSHFPISLERNELESGVYYLEILNGNLIIGKFKFLIN